MVLTRSQAAKNKADQSPEQIRQKPAPKQPRKQQASDAEDEPLAQQQQRGKPSASAAKRVSMGAKLSALKKGPNSHPISSLPSSPMPRAGSASPDFTIPAAAAPPPAAPPAQQQPQPAQPQAADDRAVSVAAVEKEHPQVAAAAEVQPAAPQPAAPRQQQPAAQPAEPVQQQAPPLAQQPRPEKLLKPLPDKPVPCDKLPDGPEPVVVEVEYFASADLAPLGDPAGAASSLDAGLAAADWVEAVRALNVLRQLVVHHPEACASRLDTLVPLVLKSVRSLRSSVCKTAIMAVADLYQRFGDALLPATDVGGAAKPLTSMLAQVLLKCSSNDKKFVIEEAQRAMQVMVDSLSPAAMLPLLLPYADVHKNPKVRGKAGAALAAAVARMPPADVAAAGLPRLLQLAGKLVTDNTPDARDSAKRLIGLIKAAFADPGVEAALGFEPPPPPPPAEGEEARPPPTRWEAYCQANLSGSAALAVLKASSE